MLGNLDSIVKIKGLNLAVSSPTSGREFFYFAVFEASERNIVV